MKTINDSIVAIAERLAHSNEALAPVVAEAMAKRGRSRIIAIADILRSNPETVSRLSADDQSVANAFLAGITVESDQMIRIRVTSDQIAAIKANAERHGFDNMSEYLRSCAVQGTAPRPSSTPEQPRRRMVSVSGVAEFVASLSGRPRPNAIARAIEAKF
jgi:hypothetical protein